MMTVAATLLLVAVLAFALGFDGAAVVALAGFAVALVASIFRRG